MRATAALACLALAACAGPQPANMAGPAPIGAVDWSKAVVVEVELDDFHFRPDTLQLARGAPVTLVLRNVGTVEHNFVAPRFFAEAVIRQGEVRPGVEGIAVRPGEKRKLRLTPTIAGSYGLECTRMLHAMLGMSGSITVTE